MRLAVRKSEPLNFLKCFPILLFSLIGSFSLLLSPQIKFALVLLLGMIVLLNLGRMRISNKITLKGAKNLGSFHYVQPMTYSSSSSSRSMISPITTRIVPSPIGSPPFQI